MAIPLASAFTFDFSLLQDGFNANAAGWDLGGLLDQPPPLTQETLYRSRQLQSLFQDPLSLSNDLSGSSQCIYASPPHEVTNDGRSF